MYLDAMFEVDSKILLGLGGSPLVFAAGPLASRPRLRYKPPR
jgi:hypothetical protein